MNVLVTGGAGYIGTHTIVELIASGHSVIAVDNFINSSPESLRRVKEITGINVPCYNIDLCNALALDEVFTDQSIDAVIHFASLKSVGESVKLPLKYYANNLDSTLRLLECMERHDVHKLIFSSSATVYGNPSELPLVETSEAGRDITNPYGWTKFMIEQMLQDVTVAIPNFKATILRYFNPIGAHDSGLIGEDPHGVPNNLLPYIAQVAIGKRTSVQIFGNDYETVDGTGVRDYIHVTDLARGHVAALEHMQSGAHVYNLGTGKGTSVLELITAFEKASGQKISYTVTDRRPGDIASCYADATKAKHELGWQTAKSIDDACRDSWRWQSQNPNGYQ